MEYQSIFLVLFDWWKQIFYSKTQSALSPVCSPFGWAAWCFCFVVKRRRRKCRKRKVVRLPKQITAIKNQPVRMFRYLFRCKRTIEHSIAVVFRRRYLIKPEKLRRVSKRRKLQQLLIFRRQKFYLSEQISNVCKLTIILIWRCRPFTLCKAWFV